MDEKPYEQLIIESLLKDVYTLSFAKVTKVDSATSFLEVKNIMDGGIITDVPLLQLGNSTINIKINIKVGDLIPIFHTKDDVSLFLAQGTEEENNALESFSRSNAVAFPFKLTNFLEGFTMPSMDIEILGNLKVTGNIEVEGSIQATDEISSDTDIKIGSISLKKHVHPYTWTDGGGSGNTSPPT
jgi:hypothetical protein